uniref:Uncharacterized protein n=1 Tax=Setaria italica TaxID=4555 RepID=K4A416_SETIT
MMVSLILLVANSHVISSINRMVARLLWIYVRYHP